MESSGRRRGHGLGRSHASRSNSDETVSDSNSNPLYEVEGGLIDLRGQMGGYETPVDGVSRVEGLVRNI